MAFTWLIKLVSIFLGGNKDDKDITRGKYRQTLRVRQCDNCNETPDYLYDFNYAWLCLNCLSLQRHKFPTIISKQERINNTRK